ncbi:GGDEF domain-containing phosphodiesterase [Dyella sp.]|uniref:putative bifunctional diguanylate cyclase/phosphodiesterase n=1 Tax=Dyella sp. TaxID=1869338 RepID=UPI002D77CBB5|nr:GGDEF domain-containing phosphodiesterase [Dyella sp.]HET6433817.1 GGDEF domain-containing phosphodiesterase [Dyella sp.]
MLNRDEVCAAIAAVVADGRGDGADRAAVLAVMVEGLRDRALRLGYATGDSAADSVGKMIAAALRPVDRVFRVAYDLYMVVLPHMRNEQHALLAATRLTQAFDLPVQDRGQPWRGRPVMGIALHPDHGTDPEVLCRRAELALHEALRQGGQHAVYGRSDEQAVISYEELREAIENNRLNTFLQPIWNLQTGRIAGAESLARWTAEQHGEVWPGHFVPFAEQSGLITALTSWSINTTLRHAAALNHVPDLKFAINLSPRAFNQPGLVEKLTGALGIWGVAPERVIAEITETALVHDLDQTVSLLRRLRDRGIGVAIDDFGTGYASIAYLSKFPATELKIDLSLVRGIHDDARAARLVSAIIDMAHHLDLVAVAEGIEDGGTQSLLAEMGCDFGQGYHLGRPVPAADFIARCGGRSRG